jgi:CheY-like chemotaxis protein
MRPITVGEHAHARYLRESLADVFIDPDSAGDATACRMLVVLGGVEPRCLRLRISLHCSPVWPSKSRTVRILIVEDTLDVGEGVVESITAMGHSVDWAKDGETGEDWLRTSKYELVVLDLMLPNLDGTTLLRRLRERRNDTPVLILTARSAIDDRIDMLDLGADDYLVKPFDFRELQARVRTLLRRHAGDRSPELPSASNRLW